MSDTERVGGLIVQIVPDEDPTSPREFDNLSVIYGSHHHYTIGDGEPPADEARVLERGGIRLLYRWLRRWKGVLAFTKLGMYDHSGVSYYPVPIGSNGHHMFDEAGWDSGVVGYAYVTKERADYMGSPYDSLDRQLASEIEEYSDWASGNVWAFTITKPCLQHYEHGSDEAIAVCPHSETVGSCGGFIGDPKYALEEAINEAEAIAGIAS